MKRDMGANMDQYTKMGYCPEAVCEYVMTLLNSNYEEWRMQNPTGYNDFPFNIKKMSVSGCLFDFDKLGDVSKNVASRMTAEQVYAATAKWAKSFNLKLLGPNRTLQRLFLPSAEAETSPARTSADGTRSRAIWALCLRVL
ncbi:MAG: hypothetical protein V8S82_04550 [Eubacteriales bacterium]